MRRMTLPGFTDQWPDGLFRNGGDRLIVPVVQDGEGYAGTFNLGVQLT